jgi:transcription factor TFIIIB component B''
MAITTLALSIYLMEKIGPTTINLALDSNVSSKMSHTRTTVSASVIKSTSRFAPKAVPRKPPKSTPSRVTPAPPRVEEEDEDEEDEEDESESEKDNELDDEKVQPRQAEEEGGRLPSSIAVGTQQRIPPIQSSIPSTATPISIPSIQTVSFPTALPTASLHEPTSTSEERIMTRKRRAAQTTDTAQPRRRRKTTPPTAEEVVIIPSTAKMLEMCVDKRTGRKSSRYGELREAERQRKKLKELKREQERNGVSVEPPPAQEEVLVPAVPVEDDTLAPVVNGTARVMTDESGNIILDQSSLQVDRHAIHPSTLTDSLVHTTETVFSSKTNSATYPSTRSHASNKIRWLPEDNDRFYTGLRMFGTDFGLVATYIGGGKQRRHIKNKFDREEKTNSDKVTWALKNRLSVDMAELEERRGTKFKNLEEIQEELKGLKAEAEIVKSLPPLSEGLAQHQGQSTDSVSKRSIASVFSL